MLQVVTFSRAEERRKMSLNRQGMKCLPCLAVVRGEFNEDGKRRSNEHTVKGRMS